MAEGFDASFLQADVRSKADMERMAQVCIERYGRIDILCLNAGIYPNALIADMTDAMWDEELALMGTGLRASPGLGRFGENRPTAYLVSCF